MKKSIDETETDLCRALWLSVLMQQPIDATGKAKTKRAERNRIDALVWLSSRDNVDSSFSQVCHHAGIDPVRTSNIVSGILGGTRERVDFRCSKKALPKNRSVEHRKSYFTRAKQNAISRKAVKMKV